MSQVKVSAAHQFTATRQTYTHHIMSYSMYKQKNKSKQKTE